MDSTYIGSYGRLRVYQTEFFSRQQIDQLLSMTDPKDVSAFLYNGPYREDYDSLAAVFKDPDLTEMAINRHMVRNNRLVMFSVPPLAKNAVMAYLSKWDIENIKTVISAKFLGHGIRDAEPFLVSFRDVPLGIMSGTLTSEDYRNMINLPNVEAILNYLARFGYGTYMMQFLEDYRKTGDISPMLYSLDRYYYLNLISALKYYRGDEGPVLNYVRSDIDRQNIVTMLKGKVLKIAFERMASGIIDGGNIGASRLREIYSSQDVVSVVDALKQYYDLEVPKKNYMETGNLYHFDIAMRNIIARRYLDTMSMLPLSLDSLFYFMLRSEFERHNLRTIYLSRVNGMPREITESLLITEMV
ncbi:V-type ATP synthase subunit C [Thermoplasma sp.]|uniref:V-type ATP synthase subunit C n=1 Tax=Thermoplasma sp. TaxID=1973142 RepID=UPI001273277B|nr:V-type ATP synthase subunit C [Thermoplasma sp.]KAA8922037.1 MAG: V-type ATP synthase subunit C [Thermoplasma sp.]